MTIRTNTRKSGQVFAIDVLFSILPIVMIVGASLQYMYLAEESAMSLTQHNHLENAAQAMADYVMSEFQGSWDPSNPSSYYTQYIDNANCPNLRTAVTDYNESILGSMAYNVRVSSTYDNSELCRSNTAGTEICSNYPFCQNGDSLDFINDTAASVVRFMPEFDPSGNTHQGRIAEVTFTVWEK